MADIEGETSHRMLAVERRKRILDRVEREGSITIADIKAMLKVSAVTARADLEVLEEHGKIVRIYGGAVSPATNKIIPVPQVRGQKNIDVKKSIARRAAELVKDGETLFIDTGSTTFSLVHELRDKKNLRIVTNDFEVMTFVESQMPDCELIVIGGVFRRGHRYTYGELTTLSADSLFADRAFLGAASLIPEHGFMTEFEQSVAWKMAIIAHSRQSYVLLDASKVGASGFIRYATLADVTGIITDSDPDGVIGSALEGVSGGAELLIA